MMSKKPATGLLMASSIVLGILTIALRIWLDACYLARAIPVHVMYAEPDGTVTETVASSIACEDGTMTVVMPDGSSATVSENAFAAWRDIAANGSALAPAADIRLRLPDGTVLELSGNATSYYAKADEPETVLFPRHIWRVVTEDRTWYVSPDNLSVLRGPG